MKQRTQAKPTATNASKANKAPAGIWFSAPELPTSIFMVGEAERDGVPLLDYSRQLLPGLAVAGEFRKEATKRNGPKGDDLREAQKKALSLLARMSRGSARIRQGETSIEGVATADQHAEIMRFEC